MSSPNSVWREMREEKTERQCSEKCVATEEKMSQKQSQFSAQQVATEPLVHLCLLV